MASPQSLTTGVFHDDDEVAVRARSQHSRDAHVPATDGDGDVIFVDDDGDRVDPDHDDARPKPKCGQKPNKDDTEWVLRACRSLVFRDECSKCFTPDAVADQNKKNGGSKTLARRLRWGDDWGSKETSDTKSHTTGD